MNSHVFSARHAALWAAKQLFFSPLIRDLNLEQQILGAFCRELLPVSHNRANALTCFFACSGFRRFESLNKIFALCVQEFSFFEQLVRLKIEVIGPKIVRWR